MASSASSSRSRKRSTRASRTSGPRGAPPPGGLVSVPEDRLTQGLFMDRAIGDNIIAGSLDRYRTRWGTLDNSKTRKTVRELFDRLRIKAPRVAAPVRSLSGGNAQRVVLAKWLAIRPRLLILNGPTVGVDVGSKQDILHLLSSQ